MAVNKFSEIKVSPGEKRFEFLNVCTMTNGSQLGLPVHVLRGAEEGPKIVVMSTAHGYEICQISVVRELVETLNPEDMKGTLILIPVANPIAFEMGTRGTWIDALWGDSGNMNRLWPGRADGWLTERMTYKISSEILPGSDWVIDMHASSSALALAYTYYGKLNEKEIELSRVFGHEILVKPKAAEIDEKMQWTTSKAYLQKAGIPSFSVEIGDFPGLWTQRDDKRAQPHRTVPEVGVTGITNVMKHLGMLEGEPTVPRRQLVVEQELNLRPSHGGLLITEKTVQDLGTVVPKGEVLGRVISPYSFEILDTIVAPFDETLIIAVTPDKPFKKVLPGEYGYIVADMKNCWWIDNE